MYTLQGQVYPLADVLKTTLLLKEKNGHAFIGTRDSTLDIPVADAILKINPSVKASYLSEALGGVGSAVLMRVVGDLYIYAVYANQANRVTVFTLDADRLPMTPQLAAKVNGVKPHVAVGLLIDGIIARASLLLNGKEKWEEEDIGSDLVGFGSVEGPEDRKSATG